jgi:outer membrane lipoprotein-sorting protein
MKFKYALAIPALALVILSLLPSTVRAESDPARKGTEIAVEMDRRDEGFGNTRAKVEMVLRDRGGATSNRRLTITTFEVIDDDNGDRTLVLFRIPRDISGTALLSHSKFTGSDSQWLFLPALKRVKRISSGNKSGPFVGSEFAYEDMLSQEHQRYTHKWLRDDSCGDYSCYVIERRPRDEDSGYTRQILWIDKKHYRPVKVEYFDRKNARLKTLVYSGYRLYLKKHWRAHEMLMENHQSGKSTILKIDSYQFRIGVNEGDFHPSRLRSVR